MNRPKLRRREHPPPPTAPAQPSGGARPGSSAPDGATAPEALRVGELGAHERRRAVAATGATMVAAWVLLFGAYYVHPSRPSGAAAAVVKMVVGVVVVVAVIATEYPRIVRARLPQLRAVEALGVSLPLFFVVFSSIYLSLGQDPHPMFSTALDHTEALYFVVTVFSTVGFGDIVPTTDAARLVVAAQMLLDLVFIGAVVRVLMTAANRGLTKEGRA